MILFLLSPITWKGDCHVRAEGDYRITSKNGSWTSFHILDYKFIPESNFELALKWYNEEELIAASVKEIKSLLENAVIRKKNKTLLENPTEIKFLYSKNYMTSARG